MANLYSKVEMEGRRCESEGKEERCLTIHTFFFFFFYTQDSFSKFYINVVLRIAQQLHQIAVVAGRIDISDSFLPLWPLVD